MPLSRKSLVLISSEFPPGPGGIGSHAYQLSLHLARRGWCVNVVAPQDYAPENDVAAFSRNLSFTLTRVPSGRGRAREAIHRIGVANQVVRKSAPGLIVGTGLSGVWVASVVSVMNRLPAIAVAHGSEFGKLGAAVSWINRRAFHRMTRIVAVSEFTRSVVLQTGIQGPPVDVIRNGADVERFRILEPAERERFTPPGLPRGARVLLTVGHVSERKGQEIVIRALPAIVRAHPEVHYCMVGLPTLKPHLEGVARELGVLGHVHFIGTVSPGDLVAWINRCELFVMTSKTTANGDCEGFGIAVVEAALCGRAAVVSSQSGLVEAIEEGVTGISAEEGNPAATAAAVNRMLENPTALAAMGQAARRRALAEQTWDSCIAKFDELLEGCLRP